MATTRMRDPFAPIEWITFVLWGLLIGAPLVLLPLLVLGDVLDGPDTGDVTFFAYGDGRACVTATDQQVWGAEATDSGAQLEDRASMRAEALDVCLADATFVEQTAASVGPMSQYVLWLVAVYLLRRLIRQGRRELFGPRTARLTTALGWVLVAGSLVTAAVQAIGDRVVLGRALGRARESVTSWEAVVSSVDVSWTLVVVGLGVVAVGRVLRWALVLQEEVDTLV